MILSKRITQILLLIVFVLAGCRENEQETESVIRIDSGVFSGRVYLDELLVRDRIPVDSLPSIPPEGASFKISNQSPGFYIIHDDKQENLLLYAAPGDKISISEGGHSEAEPIIRGNVGNDVLIDYFRKKAADERSGDSLGQVFRDSRSLENFHEIRVQLDSAYFALLDKHKAWVKDMILKNDSSIVSLFLFNQRFGRQLLFNEENAFDLMLQLDSNLYARYPQNVHVKEHHARVSRAKRDRYELALAVERLAPGNDFGMVEAIGLENETLSMPQKPGQPTLVHFWAAADAPSRKENREVRKLPKLYPELEIFSVSMDNNREAWAAAVKLDGLEWENASELLGMESPLAQKYLPERELPVYYLIDGEGKIIFRSFSIEQADSLLRSYFIK